MNTTGQLTTDDKIMATVVGLHYQRKGTDPRKAAAQLRRIADDFDMAAERFEQETGMKL